MLAYEGGINPTQPYAASRLPLVGPSNQKNNSGGVDGLEKGRKQMIFAAGARNTVYLPSYLATYPPTTFLHIICEDDDAVGKRELRWYPANYVSKFIFFLPPPYDRCVGRCAPGSGCLDPNRRAGGVPYGVPTTPYLAYHNCQLHLDDLHELAMQTSSNRKDACCKRIACPVRPSVESSPQWSTMCCHAVGYVGRSIPIDRTMRSGGKC